MTRPRPGERGLRVLEAAALMLAATAPNLVAQSRSTLETKVTAEGDEIVLKWGKKHPWDAQLRATGAFLMIEYRTASGQVGVDCLSSTSAASTRARMAAGCTGIEGKPHPKEERARRFTLPDAITAAPSGEVCLYFRLPDRRILPIRRADEGRETARFHYLPWSELVGARARRATLEAEREALARAVAAKTREVEQQTATNAQKGWESISACEQVSAPELQKARVTRPVARPEQRDDVARLICTMRVANADAFARRELVDSTIDTRLLMLTDPRVYGPGLLDFVLSLLPAKENVPSFETRRAQAAEFRRDYNRWVPTLDRYRATLQSQGYSEPHFGSLSESLRLQSLTNDAGKAIASAVYHKQPVAPDLIRGYAGGTLEAYTRCVEDGKAQLQTTYDATVELRERTPKLQEAARRQLVSACQAGVKKLDDLRAELARLEQQLAAMDERLRAAESPTTLPSDELTLNEEACRP